MAKRAGTPPSVRVLYLVVIGAWLLLADFALVGTLGHRLPRPLGQAGGWVFISISATLLAAIGIRRAARNSAQARLLHLQQASLEALGALTDPLLGKLPADQLLDEMLSRLVNALDVETAAAYLIRDDAELVARAAVGALSQTRRLPVDHGPPTEIIALRSPLQTDDPVEISDVAPDSVGLVSLAGCPIVIEDRLIGVCLVGTTVPKTFNEADMQLLQLVADRVAAGIEWSRLDEAERRSRMAAEHAWQHLTLLARASEVLSTAIDNYEPVLAALVDVVVPDFADWCGIDVVEPGGQRRRLAVRQTAKRADSPEPSETFASLEDLSVTAARTGTTQQVLRSSGPPGEGDRLDRPAATEPAVCVIVPVAARQRTYALITVAADAGRPGYEPSDVSVLEQLAGRASLAVERVVLYRELRAREAQWRSLVEATPAGIVEVDLDGRILVWNRFAAGMFGWDGSTAPSFAAETKDALSELWSRAASGEEIVDTEVSALVANAERRDLAVSVAPLRAGGAVVGILTLAVDVSERRRLQEGLQAAQRTEALGQVAGAIAHDFNNLLTVITGYSELLRRRTPDDESQRLLENIRNSADKAAMLTSQLLAIGHRQVAKPVVLVPGAAIEAMRDVLSHVLGVDIALDWRLDDLTGNIRIDPGQLERLILNLVINARDAMPNGGTLTICVADEWFSVPEAAFLGIAPGRAVRITVADTGIGMDEKTRGRCLEPFFTTKDRSKGTGLGLAAVKGIVDEGGGTIDVESHPGVGTTFTIYLPAIEEEATTGDAAPQEAVARGTETVLVVDDEPDLRQLIRKVLTHDGYRVMEAASGGEAISLAKHWKGSIDLLISDVMMPGMRGTELAFSVRAVRPSIKVLLISGYANDERLPADAGEEQFAFLAKPFKPSELADRVRQILD